MLYPFDTNNGDEYNTSSKAIQSQGTSALVTNEVEFRGELRLTQAINSTNAIDSLHASNYALHTLQDNTHPHSGNQSKSVTP